MPVVLMTHVRQGTTSTRAILGFLSRRGPKKLDDILPAGSRSMCIDQAKVVVTRRCQRKPLKCVAPSSLHVIPAFAFLLPRTRALVGLLKAKGRVAMTFPSATSSSSATAAAVSGTAASSASMHRSPSCEWREWDEMLDNVDTVSGFLGIDHTSMDVVEWGGLDQFLLATADDFLEPFAASNATRASPIFAAEQGAPYENDQDLDVLFAAGVDVPSHASEDFWRPLELKAKPQTVLELQVPTMLPTTTAKGSPVHRHRKRKTAELHRLRGEADQRVDSDSRLTKKGKRQEQHTLVMKNEMQPAIEQMEKMYRRRYDILHNILEAWNTGGIEDLEEIADNVYDDDVTLISPDYAEGLHGVEAVMAHWSLLLDTFPDGMMEEYIIQREEGSTEKMKATWTFSGTQIFPILGVEPRHKKVCISGKSLFIFKGERIRQIVLSWNYGETLLKLMGVQPEETDSVPSTCRNASHFIVNQ